MTTERTERKRHVNPPGTNRASEPSPQPMNYLPLARKYRPQTFQELVGQPHVTATLTRAIDTKRIGQAYLLTGQRGVGKTSAARILARCLNCAHGPTTRPCQTCPSCVAIRRGNSLDVIEIDGASNRGIDDIRQLREQVKFAPVQGQFRVYIIDEVHQITPDAFNALLKTLEEPPAHVKFIFATTAPQKVPPTILSRCQRFDFRRLESKTIVSALKQISETEHIAIDEAALYAIARASEGSLRDAEVVLEQLVSFCSGPIGELDVTTLLGAVEQQVLLTWTQALLDHDAKTALLILTQQLDRGKDVTQALVGLLMHLRNLLILRTTAEAPSRDALLEQLLDVPPDQLSRLDAQARHATPEEWLVMVQLLTGAYELSRRTPFAQAILEFALIKLATRESWSSLTQIMQRLEGLTRELPSEAESASTSSTRSISPSDASMRTEPSEELPNQPPPESPAASDATGSLSLEVITEQWPHVLARIGQQKMSLAAYLTDARPLRVSGSRIHVGLPAFALHQEVLNVVENRRLIEQALGDVLTQPLQVDYVTLPDAPPPTEEKPVQSAGAEGVSQPTASSHPAPPIVHDIVKLFNATIISQPHAPS